MHFNDLCLRIRSFAVSILGVLLGSAAVAHRFAGHIELFSYKFPTATLFIGISIVVWSAFYVMDRYWYHELLKGAVHHGLKIEENLSSDISEINLANSIREQSHSSLHMNAAKKLHLFYLAILFVQLIAFFALMFNVVTVPS